MRQARFADVVARTRRLGAPGLEAPAETMSCGSIGKTQVT
jgi:hypothetical protein